MIPTREECYKLWDKYQVPENIRRHCELVSKIGVVLGRALQEKGERVNVDIVERAGLLHDLLRSMQFPEESFKKYLKDVHKDKKEFIMALRDKYKDMFHGGAAAIELQDKYPEITETIKLHGFPPRDLSKHPIEETLVNYADKRADEDKIVSVEERYETGGKRWPAEWVKNSENSKRIVLSVEKILFAKLDFSPDDLKKMVRI